jgi:hypothetical protein
LLPAAGAGVPRQ